MKVITGCISNDPNGCNSRGLGNGLKEGGVLQWLLLAALIAGGIWWGVKSK